jgi:tRNA A37 methylthiotransferase MiaB
LVDRFFIQTFGCQMNEYDSAKMADVLVDSFNAGRSLRQSTPTCCC